MNVSELISGGRVSGAFAKFHNSDFVIYKISRGWCKQGSKHDLIIQTLTFPSSILAQSTHWLTDSDEIWISGAFSRQADDSGDVRNGFYFVLRRTTVFPYNYSWRYFMWNVFVDRPTHINLSWNIIFTHNLKIYYF